MRAVYYDEIDSTNLEAVRLLEKKNIVPPFIVMADNQTAGRGQGSNSWSSERGKNLTCSYVIEPEVAAEYQYLITVAASVSVLYLLKKYIPDETIKIKWPNDIYVSDKKICGILVSNKIMGNLITISIIGIGLNVNQESFDNDLPNPISLKQIVKSDTDIFLLMSELSDLLLNNIEKVRSNPEQLVSIYKENLYKIGEPSIYTINGEKKQCIISDIDKFGNIVFK